MTDAPNQVPTRGRTILSIVVVLVLVAGAGLLGWLLGRTDGLVAAATISTALGTLALAWQTYSLARATRQSVAEAGDELDELRKQRELLEHQAETAAAQAEATARLAEASSLGALAAARARIDSVAPFITTTVSVSGFTYVRDDDNSRHPVDPAERWTLDELRAMRFDVELAFDLRNVGARRARVSFGDTASRLEKIHEQQPDWVEIDPGVAWSDIYKLSFRGDQTDGEEVRMPFTYTGEMFGEMFDRIQWNGHLTTVRLTDGRWSRADKVLSSSGAQVFRTYPNLEDPEGRAAQALAIQNGPMAAEAVG